MPMAVTARRSARLVVPLGDPQGVCIIHPEASVSRIAIPVQNSERSLHSKCRRSTRNSAPHGKAHFGGRISRDQGAFAAGTPRKESYNKGATPATNANTAQ